MILNAELRPIESIWEHLAGGPGFNLTDAAFVDAALRELLDTWVTMTFPFTKRSLQLN